MNRIEVNVATGEQTVIEFTPEEEALALAYAASIAPTPAQIKVLDMLAVESANPITHRSLRDFFLMVCAAFSVNPLAMLPDNITYVYPGLAKVALVDAEITVIRNS